MIGRCPILFAVAFSIVAACSFVHAENPLDRLVGKRLSAENVEFLNGLIGDVPTGHVRKPLPRHVWKTHQGEARYIVFLGEDLAEIPGGSSASVQLFDSGSQIIRRWSFGTGWRIRLVSASLEHSSSLLCDLIIVRSKPVINGRDISKQYYSLSRDTLKLIRMENDNGELVSNDYLFPNSEIGLVPAAASVQEYIGLLTSPDMTDVLSALLFLGGEHMDELARLPRTGPAAGRRSRYVSLVEQVMADSRARKLIRALSASPNKWVREAAEQVRMASANYGVTI